MFVSTYQWLIFPPSFVLLCRKCRLMFLSNMRKSLKHFWIMWGSLKSHMDCCVMKACLALLLGHGVPDFQLGLCASDPHGTTLDQNQLHHGFTQLAVYRFCFISRQTLRGFSSDWLLIFSMNSPWASYGNYNWFRSQWRLIPVGDCVGPKWKNVT